MITTFRRNRNLYVWFIPGDHEGILASATRNTVMRFRREGDIIRQATLRDWVDAKNLRTIRK